MAVEKLVSVFVITYNHSKFIRQCLDSILCQRTTFEFEVVIGEDCSTDGTRDIIFEYAEKYHDRIKLIVSDTNVGAHANMRRTLNACTCKYIACCEGDDYWTDVNKLQIQVDIMEAHPEYSVCFHNCEEFYDDNSKVPFNYCHADQKQVTGLVDLLEKCNYIPTSAVVWRNNLVKELPKWMDNVIGNDWIIHILQAQYGKIYYINKVMSKHRHHSGGVSYFMYQEKNILSTIETYKHLDTYFNLNYNQIIKIKIAEFYHQLVFNVLQKKEFSRVVPLVRTALSYNRVISFMLVKQYLYYIRSIFNKKNI
jgi:glycosyltransferase involved in cell wall biosynthesis